MGDSSACRIRPGLDSGAAMKTDEVEDFPFWVWVVVGCLALLAGFVPALWWFLSHF